MWRVCHCDNGHEAWSLIAKNKDYQHSKAGEEHGHTINCTSPSSPPFFRWPEGQRATRFGSRNLDEGGRSHRDGEGRHVDSVFLMKHTGFHTGADGWFTEPRSLNVTGAQTHRQVQVWGHYGRSWQTQRQPNSLKGRRHSVCKSDSELQYGWRGERDRDTKRQKNQY